MHVYDVCVHTCVRLCMCAPVCVHACTVCMCMSVCVHTSVRVLQRSAYSDVKFEANICESLYILHLGVKSTC